MQTIWQDVADVTSQVAGNVATDVAQLLLDIVTEKLNDKFIVELHALDEWQKK